MTITKEVIAREWFLAVGLCLFLLAVYGALFLAYGRTESIPRHLMIKDLEKDKLWIVNRDKHGAGLISRDEWVEYNDELRREHKRKYTRYLIEQKIWKSYHDNILLIIVALYAAIQFIRISVWSAKVLARKD